MMRVCLICLCCVMQMTAGALVLKDDYRSPRNKERPLRKATRLIVLHTTEAHAKSSLNKLSERGEAHYCVTEDGTAYRIVDKDREAFHAGRSMWNGKEDCDEYSIGIEVVGWHDKHMPLAQLAALKELISKLKSSYHLADAQVLCHSHVAYGAPNTWHKKRHRGRKRCGMLFAMPSVRAKLGLSARPAYDPDVRAKRLVQGDDYLNTVLYGSVDTMAVHYGRGGRPALVATSKNTQPKKTPSADKPSKPVAQTPSAASRQTAKTMITPVVRPPLKNASKNAASASSKTPPAARSAEGGEDGGILSELAPAIIKKKARLVIPETNVTASERQEPTSGKSSTLLALPKNLKIGRMGDAAMDLAALEGLAGYVKGGPVSAELSPYRIAGAAWNAADTYYYLRGRITPGDKVDEKSVECGTLIFYRATR